MMSFRVADVVLCDIPCVSENMCVHDRCGRKVAMSKRKSAESCLFQGLTRSCAAIPLHILHSTLNTPHSTLHILHSTLCTLHSPLDTLHSTLQTLDSTLYTPHFKL